MKLSRALLAAFASTAESTTTADADGSCQLLTASCNEDGFEITFDMTCRDADYKAVKWDELYAFPTLSPDHHVWGTTCTESHDAECCFADVNGDGTLIRMNFNFKQCGTTHDDDFVDPNSLKYYNRIQGQEYYNDILLGVTVNFDVSCTADRVAKLSVEAPAIAGDDEFTSTDAVDRPADWAQNVLDMQFYADPGHTTPMGADTVSLGEIVYPQITTRVITEDIKTRATNCWATKDSGSTSTPKFDLIKDSCVADDPSKLPGTVAPLEWVTLDSATNGASGTVDFSFEAFRFIGSNSFWLHCDVYMCYDDETCTTTCPASRRKRRDAEIALGIYRRNTNQDVPRQENGLPVTNTISAQMIIRDKAKQSPSERTKKIAGNIGKNLGAIQASLKKTKNQVRNLKKIFEQ